MAEHTMSGHALVENYLAALGQQIAWRSDSEMVVAEVADHLHTATDRLVATGVQPLEAQQRVLDAFGDPDVVAVAFATTPHGGIAVPTSFTRTAGALGVAAGVWWLLWGAALLLTSAAVMVDEYRFGEAAGQLSWFGFLATLVVAAPLTYAAVAGLLVRGGAGAHDPWLIGTGLLGALTLAFGLLGWAEIALPIALPWDGLWLPWLLLLAPAALASVVVWRLRQAQLPALGTDWLLVLAWPVGIGAYFGLQALEVGPVDPYTASYLAAGGLGGSLAPLLLGVGLLARAWWLARETPAGLAGPATVVAF
jgi:hypothetical protein